MSFFLQSKTNYGLRKTGFPGFLSIVDFNGYQWVADPNCSFNAASKALHDPSRGIRV